MRGSGHEAIVSWTGDIRMYCRSPLLVARDGQFVVDADRTVHAAGIDRRSSYGVATQISPSPSTSGGGHGPLQQDEGPCVVESSGTQTATRL